MIIYKKVLDYFSLLKKFDRIASSYLFVGENDLVHFSLDIAKLVNCQRSEYFCDMCESCRYAAKKVCPDLLVIDEPHQIKIEQIRDAQRFLNFSCSTLSKKVLIINRVHNFREEAANAFLKTLEEPPNNSLIILTTSRLDNVLATIISRCRKMYFASSQQDYQFQDRERLERFLKTGDIELKDRKIAMYFIMDLIVLLRDALVFNLTGEKKRLLQESSYEIMLNLKASWRDIINSLEQALKINNDSENINVNLAINLLTSTLS